MHDFELSPQDLTFHKPDSLTFFKDSHPITFGHAACRHRGDLPRGVTTDASTHLLVVSIGCRAVSCWRQPIHPVQLSGSTQMLQHSHHATITHLLEQSVNHFHGKCHFMDKINAKGSTLVHYGFYIINSTPQNCPILPVQENVVKGNGLFELLDSVFEIFSRSV